LPKQAAFLVIVKTPIVVYPNYEVYVMTINKEKNKAPYGGKPNSLLYFIVCKLSKIFLKVKYDIKIDNGSIKHIKPPFMVLANHPSSLDPFIMAATMYPHKMNFLGTNYYFRNKLLRPLLQMGGIIPKVQFFKDTRAVRMMNKVIARKGIIAICPEGRRSTDGSQYPISDSIAKLIKLYKVPVMALVSNGAYLSMPRWSAFAHKGTIEVSIKEMLKTEQIEKLSLDEIHKAVCSSLYYNDYEWNKNKKVSFKHEKAAENLHNILHKCPSCAADKAMWSKDNRLYCKECGNTATMDEYSFLKPEKDTSIVFEDAVKWLNWQREQAKEQVQNSDFRLNASVTKLSIADAFAGSYRDAGEGELILNRAGLTFKGTVNGESTETFFGLSTAATISSEFGVNFEITDEKNTFCFFLEDGQDAILFELAIMELIKLH
jgi:1-acyl-sn-glycerol-3-phosphate acyltransferase